MAAGSLDGQNQASDCILSEEGLTVDVSHVFWVTAG